MTVKIDKNKCIGCGLCVGTCPDMFKLIDSGKAECVNQSGDKDCVEQAVSDCPAGAISK